FDAALKVGADFPVLRLPSPVPLTSGRVRPLAEERSQKKPITLEAVNTDRLPNFSGSPVSGLVWLEVGEHFVQREEGKLLKVHARTGRSKPYFDQEKLAKALATIPGMSRRDAESRARFQSFSMNSQRTAAQIEFQADFYLCPVDGGKSVRLTKGSK